MDSSVQFVLIAKRILRELKVLSEAVRAGFLGFQKQVEAVAKEYQAGKEKEGPAPEIRSLLNPLQGIQTEQRAANRDQNLYQNRNLVVSWAGVLVLLIYTLVNFGMLCAMRDANKAASDSFKKTLEQMQGQTNAQNVSADAAGKTLEESITALKIDEGKDKIACFPFGASDSANLQSR